MTHPALTSPWVDAQRTCWAHVDACTALTRVADLLADVPVECVFALPSSSQPTLMVAPNNADDPTAVRALCRLIHQRVQGGDAEWQGLPISSQWCFRLKTPQGVSVDVQTKIPSVKETTFTL